MSAKNCWLKYFRVLYCVSVWTQQKKKTRPDWNIIILFSLNRESHESLRDPHCQQRSVLGNNSASHSVSKSTVQLTAITSKPIDQLIKYFLIVQVLMWNLEGEIYSFTSAQQNKTSTGGGEEREFQGRSLCSAVLTAWTRSAVRSTGCSSYTTLSATV